MCNFMEPRTPQQLPGYGFIAFLFLRREGFGFEGAGSQCLRIPGSGLLISSGGYQLDKHYSYYVLGLAVLTAMM